MVLFHGLEGGSRSHYARALTHALRARGWRGVVAHFRGCSGEPNRLPRAYHAGDSAEIATLVEHLHARSGAAPLYAVGVSLGGNALLKWLGESGAGARQLVDRAAAVSAPVDLPAAGVCLDRGLNRLYTAHFLNTLKAKIRAKRVAFPRELGRVSLTGVFTLRAFDDRVTAPLHGFLDVEDYWTRSASKPWLKAIALPTLLLHALNAPLPAPLGHGRARRRIRRRFAGLSRGRGARGLSERPVPRPSGLAAAPAHGLLRHRHMTRLPDPRRLRRFLHQGGVIAYPTESCYGLGCDPRKARAVQRLLRIEGRPRAIAPGGSPAGTPNWRCESPPIPTRRDCTGSWAWPWCPPAPTRPDIAR